MKNLGECAWCKAEVVVPRYVSGGKVSFAASTAYRNCGENLDHVFHVGCKQKYIDWLATKPWRK